MNANEKKMEKTNPSVQTSRRENDRSLSIVQAISELVESVETSINTTQENAKDISGLVEQVQALVNVNTYDAMLQVILSDPDTNATEKMELIFNLLDRYEKSQEKAANTALRLQTQQTENINACTKTTAVAVTAVSVTLMFMFFGGTKVGTKVLSGAWQALHRI